MEREIGTAREREIRGKGDKDTREVGGGRDWLIGAPTSRLACFIGARCRTVSRERETRRELSPLFL